MREHPWNVRRVTQRHLHDHRNLLDLHFLTHAWNGGAEDVPLANPFAAESPSLEDDTTPEDVLGRIERQVHAIQLETLNKRLREKVELDEFSWRAGHECSAHRWPPNERDGTPIGPADKRALLVALHHSPLSGRLVAEAFLVRRALVSEISIELRNCPHRQAETSEISGTTNRLTCDELCRQQFHWLRGYFSHLNPAVTPHLTRAGGRCLVSW